MSELALNFNFDSILVHTISKSLDEVWFMLKDVCDVLGIGNPSDVWNRLDEDEKDNLDFVEVMSNGVIRTRKVHFINEPGLYTVILRSNSEKAKPFRRWVTHEVLPSIRKQGYYSTMPDEQLAALIDEKINRDMNGKRLARESRQQKSDMLFLERNKISHEDYVMQLRCIWGEDSYGFHKAFDDYIRWRNESKRGALA